MTNAERAMQEAIQSQRSGASPEEVSRAMADAVMFAQDALHDPTLNQTCEQRMEALNLSTLPAGEKRRLMAQLIQIESKRQYAMRETWGRQYEGIPSFSLN